MNEKVFLATFEQRLKEEFIQKCFSDIRNSDRCRLYKEIKTVNGERRGRCVAHHFNAVCGDGGGVCRGPRPATSFGPQHELPPARLVIHRTDLCP